jgi:hypothetical protein
MHLPKLQDDLIYFLHIPKTSGVSVHNYLRQAVGRNHLTDSVLWDDLLAGRSGLSEDTRIICGHFGGMLSLFLKKWPRILTMIRDPIARAVSHINHVQRAPEHPLHSAAKELSVYDYCRHPLLKRTVSNYQSRYLASMQLAWALHYDATAPRPFAAHATAFDNALFSLDESDGLQSAAMESLKRIDAVGIVEDHWKSLNLFAKTFNWPAPVDEAKLNLAAQNQWTVDRLKWKEHRILRDLNKVDLAVYKQACQVFESQSLILLRQVG